MFLDLFVLVCFFLEQLFGFSLDDFVFFGLNGFFEIFGLLGQEALGVDLVKLSLMSASASVGVAALTAAAASFKTPTGVNGRHTPTPIPCPFREDQHPWTGSRYKFNLG
ncbi:hypothetical protein CIP107561_01846 [Corynebacterium diphtheriae]|nr:hypothetical protein CIP107561_01846 [Corynebacterium diphtheriae]